MATLADDGRLPSLSEIKGANAHVNDNGYVLLTATRPVGPYLAWMWLRLGLTPRQVNYLSIVLGIVLLALAASGAPQGALGATLLCFLWQAIDVSDGTMARSLGIKDNFGGFVDYSSGMLIVAFLPFCLGMGLSVNSDGSLNGLATLVGYSVSLPDYTPLIIGAAISIISLYMRLINRILQIRFGDSLSEGDSEASSGLSSRLRWVAKNLETIGGLQAVFFFIAAAIAQLEAALFAYGIFYVLLFGAFIVSVYRGYGDKRAYLS